MPKINPADAETARCLEIQSRAAHRWKSADIVMLCVLSVIILVFGISIYLIPQSDFSEIENQQLTTFPSFTVSSLLSGEFTKDIGEFYSDQFPLRTSFIRFKAVCELAQLKLQNKGVIPCSDGTLIKRLEYSDYSKLHKNLSAVDDFTVALSDKGIAVHMAIPPRSIDVLESTLPPLYSADRSDRVWEILSEYRDDATLLRDIIKPMADDGEYVWYRTDHHWTTDGAYAAYQALGSILGYTPMPAEYFEKVLVTNNFYGTTYSSSGLYGTPPDSMYFYRYDGDNNFTLTDNIKENVRNGFYDTDKLAERDKYAAFLGGNLAHVSITDPTATEKKPTLLLIKDSYANSLVPFLAIHFDIEMIDLRSYNGSPYKLALESSAHEVLILLGADSLATADDLTKLRYGMTKAGE